MRITTQCRTFARTFQNPRETTLNLQKLVEKRNADMNSDKLMKETITKELRHPIYLRGLPFAEVDPENKLLSNDVDHLEPECVFVQCDPMPYLNRFRKLGIDLQDEDDEEVDNSEETVTTMDIMRELNYPLAWNETITHVPYLQYLHTYENSGDFSSNWMIETLEDPTGKETQLEAIQNYLNDALFAPEIIPPYADLTKIAKMAVMTGQKLLLGDMPESLFRETIATITSLEDMKQMYSYIIEETGKQR